MEMFGDFESLKALAKIHRLAPRKLPRATGNILNTLAFETRTNALDILNDRLIIRRPGFARRQMRVDKARTSAAISSQRATVGSVALGKFTGWAEQEHGKRGNRTHFATVAGRRGSKKNVVPPRFRLNKDYPEQGSTRLGAFLAMMERRKGRKPFVMKGGLFKFVGKRKIKMLQSFEKPKKTKRLAWMTLARRATIASNPARKLWNRELKFLLTPRK